MHDQTRSLAAPTGVSILVVKSYFKVFTKNLRFHNKNWNVQVPIPPGARFYVHPKGYQLFYLNYPGGI